MVKSSKVLDWLLEENQPCSQYFTLRDILGYSESHPDVKTARSKIAKKGWAYDILKKQKPKGNWEQKDLYRPKYTATNWRALVLSDLGLDSSNKQVAKAASLFFSDWLDESKENNVFNDEVCVVGNTARMLTKFGYGKDPRVKRLYQRLLDIQKEDGGWHCFKSNTGTLDCWEALAAFEAIPKQSRSRKVNRSIERGAEFYLEGRLFKEGKDTYLPWLRFHYPNHYYYDILVGLDLLTKFGYSKDQRLKESLAILEKKKSSSGTWKVEKTHPDVGPRANYSHQRNAIRFEIEAQGKPSKWITIKALSILKRVES
ncbi:MAG: hypothetical protein ACYCQJ_06080 [Nitrososphaerales archaeon]